MSLALALYSLSNRAAQDDVNSNTTEGLPSCANQYRSLAGIIWSCFTTMFLCVWVSLHLNVPEPVDTDGLIRSKRFKFHLYSFVRNSVSPFIVTLVFPEWVLSIAVRQFVMATKVAKEIGATRQQGFFIIMGGFHRFERGHRQSSNQTEAEEKEDEATRPLVKESAAEEGDSQLGQTASGETINVEEEFGYPVHPLDRFDVCRLIKARKLRLPPSAELNDKCKSDGMAKLLVLVQTCWFIAQCIARKASNLPLAELEVITLGYTIVTLAMYIAWWDKPYHVTFPIRVFETLPERTEEQEAIKKKHDDAGVWTMALAYTVSTHDRAIELRSRKRVPMFYSGNVDTQGMSEFVGLIIIAVVGMLFGAIHFFAWSSPFPSQQSQYLWRFGTVLMTAVPPAAFVGLFIFMCIRVCSMLLAALILFLLMPLPFLYFIGRGITLVLALMTLGSLTVDFYRDVEWSDIFPHV